MCDYELTDWDREVIEALWGDTIKVDRDEAILANLRLLQDVLPEYRGLARTVALKRAALVRLGYAEVP